MIAGIRVAATALGRPEKQPATSEHSNRLIARRSLVAASRIEKGEPFGPDNLAAKRPGTGLSPMLYWRMLGQPATRTYKPDDPIRP